MTVTAESGVTLKEEPLLETTYIVLDVETRKSAKEVGGWDKLEDMGVACIVIFDSRDEKYRVYSGSGVHLLAQKLQEVDVVIGFNLIKFDFPVMQPHTSIDLSKLQSFDILLHLQKELGHRVSLDSCSTATLGEEKSADGLQSLEWWKEYVQAKEQGNYEVAKEKINEIIAYCKQDVKVTKNLYLFGKENGYLKYINTKTNRANKVTVNFQNVEVPF